MKDQHLFEKQLSYREIYAGKIIDLRVDKVQLPNGDQAVREVVHHKSHGAAVILPLLSDGQVLLVRQFRYPMGRPLLEVPAGKLDPGEAPLDCARRELREETGGEAKELLFLGEIYPSPGILDEVLYLYLATDLTFTQQKLDEDEFVELVKMPLEELISRIMAGEIKDSKTIIAALKTDILKKSGRI